MNAICETSERLDRKKEKALITNDLNELKKLSNLKRTL
jgi:hypothetical protein